MIKWLFKKKIIDEQPVEKESVSEVVDTLSKEYIYDIEGLVVSEPVISFCRAFRDNPRRFRIKINVHVGWAWIVEDTLLSKQYELIESNVFFKNRHRGYLTPLSESISFLTEQEGIFLYKFFNNYYEDRTQRLKDIRRQRMCRLYK